MSGNPRVNIIGCGRAAGSLARLWVESGVLRIADVLNRSPESTARAAERLGQGRAVDALEAMEPAEFWLIGTTDNQVSSAASSLAHSDLLREGDCVFHLAGRHGLDVLQSISDTHQKVLCAALHPVRSLTHAHLDIAGFTGTACVCEAAEPAQEKLRPLIENIGGHFLPVESIDRGLYHAAVSIISNVTKAVAWKAQGWLETAGLDDETASTISHELLQSTLEDMFRSGARQSITGPVVRGDSSTIEAHMGSLVDAHPQDLEIYRVLARIVLELAQDRGDLDSETMKRFRVLLGR